MIIESAPRQFFRAPRHNRPAPAAAATASATAESAAPAATQPPAAQPQPQPAQPHTQHQHGSGGGGHNNGGGNSNDSRQFFKKQKGQHATREHFGHGPREDRFGRQNRHDRNANRHGNQQGGGQGGHGYDKHDRQDRFSRKDRDRNQQHGNDRHQNGHAHGGTNNGHVNGHHHEDAAVAAIQAEPAIPATPAVPLPPGKTLNLRELQQMNIVALHEFAKEFVENSLNFKKHDLICEILKRNEARGGEMIGEGILELLPEGYGFLRAACFSYATCPEDVFLTPQQVRRYGIRKGDHVTGLVRAPKPNEKYFTMMRVDTIHGIPAEEPREKAVFDNLTPIFPNRRIILEGKSRDVSMRVLDLLCPIGFGQRGLIIAPPRVGKTILLQKIASAIMENNPDVHLIMLLIDERPEEVTDMERTVKGEVISSTFDESPERHIHVCEMVAERAKRLVENKKDVVILLDSITRLSRAYNNMTQGGRTGSGGLDTNALQKPKRFFGAARNLEEGGSLTIIATALVDTGSRMDQVIYEEYKGTGNLDIQLDRSLAERRIFPALNINASGTRKDDGLYHRDELDRINLLRRALHLFTPIEAMEALIKKLILSDTNMELLMSLKPDGMQM
ncbi:transcription termination factor Rho [Verrucomicrobia bacterium LW23]|nr:transcription termination factor Rho [Verrucomicrobia bacterium LW23]